MFEYAQELREKLLDLHEQARQNIEESSMEAKYRYDVKSKLPDFQVGDIVCLCNPQKKIDRSTRKLLPRWQEGYKSIKKISSVTFQIQKSSRSRIMTDHADRLWLIERPSTLPVKKVSWEVKTVVLGQKKFFRSRKSNSRRSFSLLSPLVALYSRTAKTKLIC